MKRILAVLAVVSIASLTAEAVDTYVGGRVSTLQPVGGRSPDGGAAPITLDSAGNLQTSVISLPATTCSAVVQTVVSVGVAAGGVTIPASPASNRRELVVCVSAENPGFPKVKCQVDPLVGHPVMGLSELGDVLQIGNVVCVVYPISTAHAVRCVSDTAATAITTSECVP